LYERRIEGSLYRATNELRRMYDQCLKVERQDAEDDARSFQRWREKGRIAQEREREAQKAWPRAFCHPPERPPAETNKEFLCRAADTKTRLDTVVAAVWSFKPEGSQGVRTITASEAGWSGRHLFERQGQPRPIGE
jgi:hypothetical protein